MWTKGVYLGKWLMAVQISSNDVANNKPQKVLAITEYDYSLLRPFLCFTTNQFAHKLKILANLITYFFQYM